MNAIGLSPKRQKWPQFNDTVNFANLTAMGLLTPNRTKRLEEAVAKSRVFRTYFVFRTICRTADKAAIVQMRRHGRVITSRGQVGWSPYQDDPDKLTVQSVNFRFATWFVWMLIDCGGDTDEQNVVSEVSPTWFRNSWLRHMVQKIWHLKLRRWQRAPNAWHFKLRWRNRVPNAWNFKLRWRNRVPNAWHFKLRWWHRQPNVWHFRLKWWHRQSNVWHLK